MSNAELISGYLTLAVTGPAWHGPSLDELLEDVTAAEAAARPIKGAHTIAELVAHIGVWVTAVEERLAGKPGRPSEKEQWAPLDTSSDAVWKAGVQTVRDRHASLSAAVQALDDETLASRVKGRNQTVAMALHGIVEHDAYHGGQIAILKKALRG